MEISGSNKDHFLKRQYLSPVSFGIAVLLFLMPFAEFKCNSGVILSNSGLGIATGHPWKQASDFKQDDKNDKMNDSEKIFREQLNGGPNIFALVALTTGLFGVLIYFSKINWRFMAAMCAAMLGVIMMIAVMVQYRMQISGLIKRIESVEKGLDMKVGIEMRFTIWYYLSLLFFIMPVFLNYIQDLAVLKEAIDQSKDFDFQQE